MQGHRLVSDRDHSIRMRRIPSQLRIWSILSGNALAATAAHAATIYLKCWARGLTGDQRNSVYINGEQVTVNLDEATMHSWTFGSNFAVHVTDRHLFFETALTLGNI